MWELDHKEGWMPKNLRFWTVVLGKTLESPLHIRRSNQSILKEINSEYSLKGLVMKLKLQYFGHPLPSIFLSFRVFSNDSVLLIRWPKYWNCSFSIGPSNEYSGLISFRINWLDLLAVQGTLKSLFQHQFESSNSWESSLLYGPTLTSIHDHWKNHSFDYVDLCWQSDVSAF